MHSRHVGFSRKARRCLLFSVLLWVAVGQPLIGMAQEAEQSPPARDYGSRFLPGPYCGISCMYAVLKMAGREVEYKDLIKREYIGSYHGSSIKELQKLAEDYGLYTLPARRLTTQRLRECPCPVLLHVKKSIASKRYDHFELFLGKEGDQARVFDAPNRMETIPFRLLAPRWDGRGMLISAEPIDLAGINGSFRKRFILHVIGVVAAIALLRWLSKLMPRTLQMFWHKRVLLSAGECMCIIVMALFIAVGYHTIRHEGLMANTQAVSLIQQGHRAEFIPKIGVGKVERLISDGAVFVDARFSEDFDAGHLDGAMSIPVDTNEVDCGLAMAGITVDTHIVVYCMSSGCRFADEIAVKLVGNGFQKIAIFRGGWVEWRQRRRHRTG